MQATWQADSGERDKALNSLAEAATVAPFDRSSLHNAAVLYSQLGDWAASGNLLKQAYELAPNSFDSVLALGVFYGKTGQDGLCKDFLMRADQMKPDDPTVHRYLDLLNTQTQGRLGVPTT